VSREPRAVGVQAKVVAGAARTATEVRDKTQGHSPDRIIICRSKAAPGTTKKLTAQTHAS